MLIVLLVASLLAKKYQFFGDNLVMKIKTKNLEHPDSVACHSETPSNGRDRN